MPGAVLRRLLRSRRLWVPRGELLRRVRLRPALLGARLRRIGASRRRHPPIHGRPTPGCASGRGSPHGSRSPRRRGTCRSVPVRRPRPFALRIVVGGTHVLISNR
ncbi:hypothetical protein RAJCM14343_1015 [Rhodococcus aetherivorans]|uniref:Uncharacterized protein n=1 Tax=Rhodococcus aetherivorans TaxID=191292 RepID=A0ABQ0YGU1_9NOCA|nr:hypothetical protein RAJCM14343_1015 [Rhodococcus aetherivorans]CCW10209.1 hypothetical protein EBESD8_7370 [Rhodococcus aetherivorans]